MSSLSKMKEAAVRAVSDHSTLVVAGVGAFAAIATFAVFSGAIDLAAAQVTVCNGQSMSKMLKDAIHNLINFMVFVAFGGGIVHSTLQHMKLSATGSGKKFWKTDSIRAAFLLPIALYGVDFALSSSFGINITCLLPWG